MAGNGSKGSKRALSRGLGLPKAAVFRIQESEFRRVGNGWGFDWVSHDLVSWGTKLAYPPRKAVGFASPA